MKSRILIKVSGASLKSTKSDSGFDLQKISNLVNQIKKLSHKHQIGLVVGGGNIFRGNLCSEFGLDHNIADQMGMLATIINGLLLQHHLAENKVRAKVFSEVKMDKFVDEYTYRAVDEALNDDIVCIFVGGTGSPFFTTDTGAALKASEIHADLILMGKNGVDGVFDKDPKKYKNAKHFESLTYDQALNLNLEVMDRSALTMCASQGIKILVFNIDHEDCFVKAIDQKIKTTTIYKEKK